ncbi:RNA polymerase sigma factor [Motiliproteus sediminis]|uniref:RNA polymerase sigma factor n=1 Tax=Motiliproteus sediminis TaxID=1468178 RepID=UPI001AEF9B01|nr:RNA polymerase sigma factor [Motiliproteus sediminis]
MRDAKLEQAMVALQPKLRRFAYGLSGSPDTANELVQCTYERALTRLDQWQPGTRLDSWMYRILQSIWLNQIRAGKVRGAHLDPIEPDTQGCEMPARRLEAGMMLETVQRCMWQLPEEQRAALMLVAVEGLSYKEASAVLDVPVGTLTSRLARARMALSELMGDRDAVTQREVG